MKNDPKLVAAARELRDRWLEQVNADGGTGGAGGASVLQANGKYDVSKRLPAPAPAPAPQPNPILQLPTATAA